MPNVGLVLSGGGARAAYQVGALRAISEMRGGVKESAFSVLAGLSAGAINAAALAADADDFPRAIQVLTDTWMSLTTNAVYRTDWGTLAGLGARWFKDVTTGGVLGASRANYLLDTAPLRALLARNIEFPRISRHVEAGTLHRSGELWQHLGYDKGQRDLTDWLNLVHPDDREAVTDAFMGLRSPMHDTFEVEYRVATAEGDWHTVVDRGRVVDRHLDRSARRVMGITADVTMSRRAEQELREVLRRIHGVEPAEPAADPLLDDRAQKDKRK